MVVIRPVTADDVPFLWDMGWEATAVSADMRAMGRQAALGLPSVRKYLDGWGRPGDAGVVAVDETGSAWARPGIASSRRTTRPTASSRPTSRNCRLASPRERGDRAWAVPCSKPC